jgi:hypothetical protein
MKKLPTLEYCIVGKAAVFSSVPFYIDNCGTVMTCDALYDLCDTPYAIESNCIALPHLGNLLASGDMEPEYYNEVTQLYMRLVNCELLEDE